MLKFTKYQIKVQLFFTQKLLDFFAEICYTIYAMKVCLCENGDRMILKEDIQLYRGIFWITDINNVQSSKLYFTIPCDNNGNINDPDFHIPDSMSSTGSDNYNHQRVWNSLEKKYTNGKPFNYYPRGRVEISNVIAKVFHSPRIPQDALKKFVIDKFNITPHNGIKNVKLIADGSEHYRCHLDD